jgi:hypothetical protein
MWRTVVGGNEELTEGIISLVMLKTSKTGVSVSRSTAV